MARLKQRRNGQVLKVKKRPLQFSYWPMYRTTRRFGLQSSVFVTNPWTLIGEAIRESCPHRARPEAQSSLHQAEFFFNSGIDAQLVAAKPLLLYYSFMNLAKAFALSKGIRATFDKARHGISQKGTSSGKSLSSYQLEAYSSPNSTAKANLFENFLFAYSGRGLQKKQMTYNPTSLMPQMLVGHRLWSVQRQRKERFVAIDQIDTMENSSTKEIWLNLNIYADDLTRIGISHSDLLSQAGLSSEFTEVSNKVESPGSRRMLKFEQNSTIKYTSRPSDRVPSLVEGLRNRLWAIVQSIPPYRKHYLYLCPSAEQDQLLPQLATPYVLIFLLGSVTRYRPQEFDSLLHGSDGPFIQEFLSSAPKQFLYLLASDFAKRDIILPAIV